MRAGEVREGFNAFEVRIQAFLCDLSAWFVVVKYFLLEALPLRDINLECGTLSNSGFKGLNRALILLYWK